MKKNIKIIIDSLMLILMIHLANRTNGMGLLLHAILGIAEFALFVIHHLLNIRWYTTLFKGKWSAKRIVLSSTDTILMIAMILMMISSFQISGLVFEWELFPVRFQWKNIHSVCSSSLFMITAFHLALHMTAPLQRLESRFPKFSSAGKNFPGKKITLSTNIHYPLIAIGTIAFTRSRIFSYLFLLYTDASYQWHDIMQIIFSVLIILGMISITRIITILRRHDR